MESIKAGYARVTEALRPYQDFSFVNPDTLREAAERGSRVHALCEIALSGGDASCGEDEQPYVQNFLVFKERMIDEIVSVEERFYNDPLKFTGRLDLIARLKGDKGLSIIDFKTSAASQPTWRPQLAAYKILAEAAGHRISRVMALRLGGKSPLVDESTATVQQDAAIFLCALRVHHYFKSFK